MYFLSPWFLPALAAIAAPVVLHLLNRKKPKEMPWAAMRFLMADQSRRSRAALRLKDWLLLLLRMAAVAALVLFFARPMLPGAANSGGARDVILVLDTSLSVSRETGDGTAWTRSLAMAGQAVESLGSDDFVRVLEAGPSPRWLTPSALQAGSQGRAGVMGILNSLKPGSGTCRLTDALTEAVLARPAKEGLVRRIVIFTDGQAASLQPEAVAAWAAVRDAAGSLRGGCVMEAVTPPQGGTPPNVAVTEATVSREHAASGELLLFRARLKNFGAAPAGPVSLRWTMDGVAAGLNTVPAIAPGASLAVELTRSCPPGPAASVFQCELEPPRHDALKGDNAAAVLLEPAPPVPVLLVDGSLARGAKETDTGWIEAALRSAGGEPSPFSLTTVPAASLNPQALENVRAVILANPPLLHAEVLAALGEFVRNGGGLWILPGELTHAAGPAFRQALFGQGRGLSPLLLTPPRGTAGDDDAAVRLRHPSPDHPVTRLLHDARRSDAGEVRISRRFGFDPAIPEETTVLLTADDGVPFLAEKPLGAGRVLVQGAPFNLLWSDWPKHHAFVVLLHEGLWRLTSGSLVRLNAGPGEPLVCPVPAAFAGDTVPVTKPGGATGEARLEMRGGRRVAVFSDTGEPGLYTISAGERPVVFLVGRSEAESDLRSLTDSERQSLRAAGGVVFTAEPLTEKAGRQAVTHSPAWSLCAAAAALLLCGESVLAAWLLRRRHRAGRSALTLGGAA